MRRSQSLSHSTCISIFTTQDSLYNYLYLKVGFFLFQRHPTDKAYFIAKEILMTERTYKKDLEVINLVIYCNDLQLCLYLPLLPPQWFRDEVSKEDNMPEETLTLLFSHIDPLYELHAAFLKDIEQRMATWWVNIRTMEPVC